MLKLRRRRSMHDTDHPLTDRGTATGFRTEQVAELAKTIVPLAGVTHVWMLPASDGGGAALWISVRGLDADGHEHRLAVRRHIEEFMRTHDGEMRDSEYILDYYLLVDEPELGTLQVPSGAEAIAA
jgi:hypothetical protein